MMARTLPRGGVKSIALAAVGSVLMFAGTSHADVLPKVTMQFYASGENKPAFTFDLAQYSTLSQKIGESTYSFDGGTKGSSDKWELEWSLMVSPGGGGNTAGGGGAYINLANLAITNTTGQNQIFFVLVTLDLDDPITVPTFSKGDIAASIQSYTGVGATLKNITKGTYKGDPIYESLIDGVTTHTLMDFPTAITSVGSQTASDTAGFGHDMDVVTGPALDSIGIWLKIEVTKQSIATVIGLYEITPIPAPAALPLLALGALAIRRRRRN